MSGVVRAGLLTLTLLVSGAALAEERPSPAQIRVTFEAATDALDAGELERARELYLEVWKYQQTYDVATNLAGIEFHLGDFVAAAEFSRTALRLFPPSEDPQARAQLELLFGQARREVGTATIEAPAGAEVKLDGRVIGVAPLPDVFVEPGTHRFEASTGRSSDSKEVTVSKGAVFAVALAPAAVAEDAPPAADQVDAGAPASLAKTELAEDAGVRGGARQPPARPVAIVTGSVLTAASLTTFVTFRVKASQLEEDADRALVRAEWATGAGGCADSDHDACDELDRVLDRRDRAGLWSNVALGASVAFGAATIGAVVWPRRKTEATGLVVAPWVTSGARGVVVEGSFR